MDIPNTEWENSRLSSDDHLNVIVPHAAYPQVNQTRQILYVGNAGQNVLFTRCEILVMAWDTQGLKTGGGCGVSALADFNRDSEVGPPIQSRI